MGLEFGEQRKLLVGAEFVTCRVGDHGHAPGLGDPAHGIAQARPAVRHVAGLAFGEIAAKDFACFAGKAALDDVARKVRARDEFQVAGVLQRTFQRTVDAHAGQAVRHLLCALHSTGAHARQPRMQARRGFIDAEAENVHGVMGKGDRDFDARHKRQVGTLGRRACCGQAADFIVVGQGKQFHALRLGAFNQGRWLHGPVRHSRVGVQIGVQIHWQQTHKQHCRRRPALP